ncbi:MAG: tRNA glutamyl-Q(34) synthetase GluQRS [Pseudomonadales bacterium]|jgi:glutamyl-Q tRNA(Asp) synthetase|nr:tRNA glutamyl-Q(34) synthetase GluQRS [Pseudomonadales bacterium]
MTVCAVPLYRGRFAPSPTGPLHLGSLVAALASYLDAKSQQGLWLLRIEDSDPPREVPEASNWILQALDKLGLHWDETVLRQSTRQEAYLAALHDLAQQGLIYACRCSRLALADHSIYPGTCRDLQLPWQEGAALRCRVTAQCWRFQDRLQGEQAQNLARDCGDFVVRRKDGPFSYQLAVVVDDAHQGITDIVRGIDLLDSTPRQLYLQHCLRLPPPRYAHVPVLMDTTSGQKLSKQNLATPLDLARPAATLWHALWLLRQEPPPSLREDSVAQVLAWAVNNWRPAQLRGLTQLALAAPPL